MGLSNPGVSKAFLARRARLEDEAEIRKAAWHYPEMGQRYGNIIISDDKGLAGAVVTGVYSEEKVLIRDIFSKGIGADPLSAALIVEGIDFGYPYINKPRLDSQQHATGRFASGNGYPLPIFESTSVNTGATQTFRSTIFAWDEVLYLAAVVSNANRVAINGHVHAMDGTAVSDSTVETVSGHRLITVHESKSGQWFVLGMTPENQIGIKTSNIGEESGFADQTDAISADDSYFAVGQEPLAASTTGEVLICCSIGLTKAAAQGKVAAALTAGWRTPLASAKAYWMDFFDGVREKWLGVPSRLRYLGYVALQQIAVSCCNLDAKGLWMSAGPGRWYANFIRDTAWCIKAASKTQPDLAAGMIDWFINGPDASEPISGTNAYRLDGTEPGEFENTDNAATFLLAVGEYYAATQDLARMTTLETQIESALAYCTTNYVAADGHITANHPHDFGDDGNTLIPFADIKYESVIDALWIAGLEKIAPVFTALGDAANAAYCTATATDLRAHFEEFRNADGTLAHSIKPDDSLQTGANFAAATIYDAWLLENEDSFEALGLLSKINGGQYAPLMYPLINLIDVTTQLDDEIWAPFAGIVALVAARHGDMEPAEWVASQLASGVWPESLIMTRRFASRYTQAQIQAITDALKTAGADSDRMTELQILLQEANNQRTDEGGTASLVAEVGTQALSFPWSHASILELVQGLSEI